LCVSLFRENLFYFRQQLIGILANRVVLVCFNFDLPLQPILYPFQSGSNGGFLRAVPIRIAEIVAPASSSVNKGISDSKRSLTSH
jgi:hypothetical protein